jgi:hypothetical protein
MLDAADTMCSNIGRTRKANKGKVIGKYFKTLEYLNNRLVVNISIIIRTYFKRSIAFSEVTL